MSWITVATIVGALLLAWLALVLALVAAARRAEVRVSLRDVVRLVPDVLRLVRRLAGDRTLPRRTRWLLVALLGYLALPVDVVPDFLPVVGQADDVLAIALVLRAVIRSAGPAALERHWPGTPEGLSAVRRLVGA